MSETILHVENLGKAYRSYGGEWRRMLSWFGAPVKPIEERWVLRHVNFGIQPDEAVGIVGQNGAGKSTLLKLITGTYSSGMQVRVMFAVATAWRPDILIVDETLSVGDAYFQHKSFNRIREFQEMGATLLIVSHDRASIQTLC